MSEIKQQLIKAVKDLLEDGFEVDKITIRQIAYEAHISVGLINYHFGSKWKLIMEAVSSIIEEASAAVFAELANRQEEPRQKLRTFLRAMIAVVAEYPEYSEMLIKDELFSERFSTPETIVGMIREIKPEASLKEAKYLAIQVVASMQYVFLKAKGLKRYLAEDNSAKSENDTSVSETTEFETIMEEFLQSLGL